MKKLYFSILSVIAGLGVNAQSLTQANHAPAVGDMWSTKQVDSTSISDGANTNTATWNFSSRAVHNSVVSNYSCITTASSGSATTYPSANVAVTPASNNNSFYQTSAGSLVYWGGNISAGGVSVLMGYNSPGATAATYPFSFGSMVSAQSVSGTLTVLGNNGTFTGTNNVSGSGLGTLVVPGGASFSNVLKVISTQNLNFSSIVSGTINQIKYEYYHSTYKVPMFSIVTSTVSSPFGTTTQTIAAVNSAVVAGLNTIDNDLTTVSAFPNPASSSINISFNNANGNAASAEFINALGQSVKKFDLGSDKGANTVNLNIESLQPGIYFVKITAGSKANIQKITVQ